MSSPSDSNDDRSRTWQFSKTKMCKFNLVGMCTKGSQCPFAHVKTELRELPDLTCTKLCKTLIQTGLCEDRNCSYAHSKDELRATSTFHKTKLCRFSQMGHCALGSKCNFAHSEEEIRPLDTTKLPEPPVEMTPEPPRRPAPVPAPLMPAPAASAAPAAPAASGATPARVPRTGATQALQQQQRQLEQQQQQLQQQQMQQQIQMQQQQLQQQHQQLMEQQQQNKMLALALQHQLALSTNNFLRENIFPQSLPTSGTDAESRQEREAPKRRGGRRGKAVRSGKGDGRGDDISGAPPGIPAWGVDGNLWIPGQVRSPNPCAPGPISLTASDADRAGVPLSNTNVTVTNVPVTAPVPTAPAGCGPAYVNSSMVNKTFLESELGPIGKMRPIRSAAGRLDRLAASESDEEEAQVLDSSLYDLSQAAGLVSHLAAPHLEVQLKERENRAGSAGATSAGSTQACPSHASTCLNAANGLWDSQLYAQSYSPSLEREDVWQVKNTFLTLSPRAKPIRSVRTADGALCELGSLLDDEA